MLFLPASIFAVGSWSNASSPLLAVTPETIDMGIVQAGGRNEVAFSLTNLGTMPVSVARIETSCKCVKVELPNGSLAPRATAAGRARIDLGLQPGFTGNLAITAKGVDESGGILFAVIANVEVLRN